MTTKHQWTGPTKVIRWCGSAAAGTETARMNQMREAFGDPDEGTAYVLASDYDALRRHTDALMSGASIILNPDFEGQQQGWDELADAHAAYQSYVHSAGEKS